MKGKSGQVLLVNILFWTLSWTFVSLRIYVRTCMLKSFGRDDWMMLVTLALFTVYLTCQLGGIVHGTGQLRKDLTDESAEIALQFWWLCELFYTCSTGALKIAVALVLQRFTTRRLHIWILRLVCLATIIVCTIYFFIALFQCKPVSYWWDLNETHKGTCIGPKPLVVTSYVASALNSIADWSFGILPIFMLKDLHMKRQTKYMVAGILGFASIGCLATLIRMPYVQQFASNKGEWLYDTTDLAIWSTVEVGVGITAASLPTLRPLLQPLMYKFGIDLSAGGTTPELQMMSVPKERAHSRLRGLHRMRRSDDLEELTGRGDITLTTITAGGKAYDLENSPAQSQDGGSIEESSEYIVGINRSIEFSTSETVEGVEPAGVGADEKRGLPAYRKALFDT